MPEKLEAGTDLDILVAEKVMSLKVVDDPVNYRGVAIDHAGRPVNDLPHYSSEIAAAWEVVERLRAKRWLVIIKVMPEGFPYWYAEDDPRRLYTRTVVSAQYQPMKTLDETRRYINGHAMGVAKTDPLAICRCALAVIEAEERYPVRDNGEG